MEFSYTARDAKGASSTGVLEGPDRFAVAKDLRAKGLIPLSVLPAKGTNKKGEINLSFLSRIKLRDKILFTHNLAGMISSGLTLYRALEIQKKQTKNPKFLVVIDSLLATINAGGTLSEGLSKHPTVFSPLFVSMTRAGEESGNLASTLTEIGSSLEKSYELSRKIKGAMMYPSIIVSAIIIIGALMLIFVVPTLTKIFKDMGSKLPATTQFVVTLSDAASGHPILFLGSIFFLFGGIFYVIRAPKLKRFNDMVVLKIPVVGTLVKEVNAARTTRTLSSLLLAGVEVTRALTITKEVVQNVYFKDIIERASVSVQKGDPLSAVFKAETKYYPIMVGEMMAVGEETGALTTMLNDVAKFYEEEVDEKTKNLSTIIEPVLMMFIGGAVGFFAISMITPMYSLLNNI